MRHPCHTGMGGIPSCRRSAPAAVVLVLSFVACYPRPADPVGLPVPPAPFERLPYLQAVSDTAAWVLWKTDPGAQDSVWFRVPTLDSAWMPVTPIDHRHGTRRARLAPLPPATEVEYRAAAGSTATGPFAFRTAPPHSGPGRGDAEAAELRVLLFGDSGWGGPEQIELARRMRQESWDLAIHVGDIAYDEGSEAEFTRRHFRVYAPLLALIPFYPSVGNHDVRADEGRSYDGSFSWPEVDPETRYYEFRWGRTLFLSVDTSSRTEDVAGLRRGRGRQFDWIESTLRRAASDPHVSWIVVFQHHPLYSHAIGISGHGLDRDLRNHLLPLYERYGVDLVAAGHDHHYERTWPIRAGTRVGDGCGPVHVLSGGGGASRYARDVQPSPFLAWGGRVYQYVELTVGADRIHGRTIDRAGEVVDEFTVRPFPGTIAGLPASCRP